MSLHRLCGSLAAWLIVASMVVGADPARLDGWGDPLPEGARLRLGSIRFREGSYISSLALSPDGKTIALAAGNRMGIRFIEAESGKEVRTLNLTESGTGRLAYLPNGQMLLVASWNGLRLINLADGAVRQINPNSNGRQVNFAISENSQTVACAPESYGENSPVTVHEISSGRELTKVQPAQNYSVRVAISADGKSLATWGQYHNRQGNEKENPNQWVQVWDLNTSKEKYKFVHETGNLTAAAFSPDGKHLATATSGVIYLWDLTTGKALRRFAGRSGQGQVLLFSPDSKQISALSNDGTVQSWDVQTGKRQVVTDGQGYGATAMTYLPDGTVRVAVPRGQSLQVWDSPSGKTYGPKGGHFNGISSLSFSPDGKTVYSASAGQICRWDVANGQELAPLISSQLTDPAQVGRPVPYRFRGGNGFSNAYFSADGKYLALRNDSQGGVSLLAMPSTQELCTFPSTGYSGRVEGFAPDGKHFLCATNNGRGQSTITLWEVESGQSIRTFTDMAGETTCATFSGDGKLLAVGLQQNDPQNGRVTYSLNIYDVPGNQLVHNLVRQDRALTLAFAKDNRTLVVGGQTRLSLWDARQGKESRVLDAAQRYFTAPITFSPDGRTFAVAGVPATLFAQQPKHWRISVFETATGTLRKEFNGHTGAITALAYTPDGKALASGSADTTVILWDLHTGPNAAKIPVSDDAAIRLWEDLQQPNAAAVEPIRLWLLAHPEVSLQLLREQLRPAIRPNITSQMLQTWIADLDHADYLSRERASRQIEAAGLLARDQLIAALRSELSPEAERRILMILSRIDRVGPKIEQVRMLRGLEILELLDSPQTREILAILATGEPTDLQTIEAIACLNRLKAK